MSDSIQISAGRGSSRLSKAADKKLAQHSDQIAQTLLDSTLKGNSNSARLLVTLADGATKQASISRKRHVPSLAKTLAAEPEWGTSTAEAEGEE